MSYKRKRLGKFKYILARVGNKFSWQIYLQTRRRSDFSSIYSKKIVKNGRARKKKILPSKFRAAEHEKCINFILPGKVMFRESIPILTKIFREQSSLFNARW